MKVSARLGKLKNYFTPSSEPNENEYDQVSEYSEDSLNDMSDSQYDDNDYSAPAHSSASSSDYFSQTDYSAPAYSREQYYSQPSQQSFTKKQGTNIYQMNSSGSGKVDGVEYYRLYQAEDIQSVADCMTTQSKVVVADFSDLDWDSFANALHFIDGVKYILNAKMEAIANKVFIIVPAAIELNGDFYAQFDGDGVF